MGEAAVRALEIVIAPGHLGMLVAGILVGLGIGILPGLGGIVGMAILLPFIYGMDRFGAMAMMIGMLAVVPTSDTFPSVLMGIPGSSGSQATILDGYPLAQQGQAARALSAAFAASLFGGLFGALVLTLIIPISRPIVLAFGSPELFMLTLLGLSMVGVLSGRRPLKGLMAAAAGLLLGAVGGAPAVAHYRYTFDHLYLMDGIPLVVVGLALFAVPEVVDLLIRGTAIARQPAGLGTGWLQGVRDAIAHKWLVLRHSLLGVLVGFLPGLGGSVVDWLNYGFVVQTSRDKERFGKGDIRGVLAPESANNAKEGGALIPTLLFGVPGSGATAILLGGLLLMGVQPGPSMLRDNLDFMFVAIWSLALANVIGAGLCIVLSRPIARLTFIPFPLLAPFVIIVVTLGAFQATRHWGDLIALMVLGGLAWVMKRIGMPRPPMLVGYVLSHAAEQYLWISMVRYDFAWLGHPAVVVIGLVTIVLVLAGVFWRTPVVRVREAAND